MNFYICSYPCMHHSWSRYRTFLPPQKFPLCYLISQTSCNDKHDIIYIRLVLPVLELHINGIVTMYFLHCLSYLSHLQICEFFHPGGAEVKASACNVGDLGSIPVLGRSPGEGKGYPLQYSGLENSVDYSPWSCKELDTTE